ncbi:TrkH family potassium uptake protein [Paenibacillus illinoisensis]|uniref:Trk-type K+ transporter membrane component n=1 Tax=Paenibacillus illinoisensis TaxID=59845 RepID=A0A2W0CF25_9BACL|nr:TrkH family potassium uptake protein [Paenibacillus illinoisensis]PYY30857.1 Trk-type K+ transporter membrane component [Paenibacillus illinoisensis]
MKFRLHIAKFLSPPLILVGGFLLIISIGTILLMLPISNRSGEHLAFIDALFTATSAACVTGLVVVDVGTTFNLFGQIVIMVLMQLGGLGFMTIATLFALVLGKRISLKDRLLLKEAINADSMEGIVRIIRKVLIFSFTIEGVAAVILALRWAAEMPLGQAAYYGIFHSVSLFNNGGFDLFGNSFQHYTGDLLFNLTASVLVISGGLGFVVLNDLFEFHKRRRLSLQSKLVLSVSGALIGIGTLVVFIFEFTNGHTLASLTWPEKIYASIFQSVSTRSSGTSSIDITEMRQATQFFFILLMFIGASPGSTGGGIKTTTFLIMIGAVYAMIRGNKDIVFFRSRVPKELLMRALTIIMVSLIIFMIVVMLLLTTEDAPFLPLMFEAASAIGTVGLSVGVTHELTDIGKFIICFTMFVGRIGPLTIAYALRPRKEKKLYRHPEGRIIIG